MSCVTSPPLRCVGDAARLHSASEESAVEQPGEETPFDTVHNRRAVKINNTQKGCRQRCCVGEKLFRRYEENEMRGQYSRLIYPSEGVRSHV